MKNHLLKLTASFLVLLPCLANATTALPTGDATKPLASQLADASAAGAARSVANLDPVLKRAKRCNSVANCQIFKPWAKNPFRNRIYLVRKANANGVNKKI